MLLPEDSVSWVSPPKEAASPTVVLGHQAIRDSAQVYTVSQHETISLRTAHLHKAVGHCSEKLSQHCPEIALDLLQKKEDLVSQLTSLPHSHVRFKLRDAN